MLELTNQREFIQGLNKFEKEMMKAVEETYRGWSVMLFNRILRTTPQWTGNAVANWAYSVGSASIHNNDVILREAAYAEEQGVPVKPKSMGNQEAIDMAKFANRGNDKKVRFSGNNLPDVFITNNAEGLSGKSYIQYLENNPGNFLRAENEPGHMVKFASDFYGNRGDLHRDIRMYRGARI